MSIVHKSTHKPDADVSNNHMLALSFGEVEITNPFSRHEILMYNLIVMILRRSVDEGAHMLSYVFKQV